MVLSFRMVIVIWSLGNYLGNFDENVYCPVYNMLFLRFFIVTDVFTVDLLLQRLFKIKMQICFKIEKFPE